MPKQKTAEDRLNERLSALVEAIDEAKEELVLDGDAVAPRTKRERYRIYRVRDNGRPELMATARTPGSVGATLCRLGAEGEFLNYCVGVLDGRDHKNAKGEWVGKWLILPWQEKGEDPDVSDAEGGADSS